MFLIFFSGEASHSEAELHLNRLKRYISKDLNNANNQKFA
jgi:hypothetical protein